MGQGHSKVKLIDFLSASLWLKDIFVRLLNLYSRLNIFFDMTIEQLEMSGMEFLFFCLYWKLHRLSHNYNDFLWYPLLVKTDCSIFIVIITDFGKSKSTCNWKIRLHEFVRSWKFFQLLTIGPPTLYTNTVTTQNVNWLNPDTPTRHPWLNQAGEMDQIISNVIATLLLLKLISIKHYLWLC